MDIGTNMSVQPDKPWPRHSNSSLPKRYLRLVNVIEVEDHEYDDLFVLYNRMKDHLIVQSYGFPCPGLVRLRHGLGEDFIERNRNHLSFGNDVNFEDFCNWIEQATERRRKEMIDLIQTEINAKTLRNR